MVKSHIYAVRAVGTEFVKIGFSTDVMKRIKSLQTGSPYPLEIVGIWPGTGIDEVILHAYLAKYRHKGEWFRQGAWLDEMLKTSSLAEFNINQERKRNIPVLPPTRIKQQDRRKNTATPCPVPAKQRDRVWFDSSRSKTPGRVEIRVRWIENGKTYSKYLCSVTPEEKDARVRELKAASSLPSPP